MTTNQTIRYRLGLPVVPRSINTALRLALIPAAWLALGAALAHAGPATPAMHPTAICNDGKTFYSVSGDHRGACSGHGGVKSWTDGSPVRSHTKKTEYK